MLPDLPLLAALALLGGLLALDGTSFGQFMVSRPLAAASLAGLVAGAPLQGAAAGLLLEALHLAVLPVGAARTPETAPAAVAAGGVYAAGNPAQAALLLVVVFGLAWEWACGRTVVRLRQENARHALPTPDEAGDPRRLAARHLRAMGIDFARGAVLTLGGMLLLALLLRLPQGFGLLPSQVRLVLAL
ncbi:MAG TPA: PTS sugar transporter subunit IIC, partial [Longimicrobiaceae bacterium]|nr:PTS sugar transporter subunit IIC [Longimicrobiaceae bacterium]